MKKLFTFSCFLLLASAAHAQSFPLKLSSCTAPPSPAKFLADGAGAGAHGITPNGGVWAHQNAGDLAVRKYAAVAFLIGAAFLCGWRIGAHRPYKLVSIPTGNARLEIPRGYEPRFWMNGVELDCKSGATIYYASKLERKSP